MPAPHAPLVPPLVLGLSLAVLAGCRASEPAPSDARPAPPEAATAAPVPVGARGLLEVATLEERREDPRGRLRALAVESADPRVRERAALALGRLDIERAGAAVTRALAALLADPAADVRAAAAFALGQRGDAEGTPALLDRWLDPEPRVRAAVVAAAGRLDDPRSRERVLSALASPLEEVRCAAALAPSRWKPEPGDGVDDALVEVALRPVRGSEVAVRAGLADRETETPEVLWRALFTLDRRSSAAGRDAYLAHVDSPDARARLFAARGLGKVPADEVVLGALESALRDADWRVAVEAVRSTAALGGPRAAATLAGAAGHGSHHVRTAVAEGLRTLGTASPETRAACEALLRDDVSAVRASALAALARLWPAGADVRDTLAAAAREDDAVVRAGAAVALGEWSTEEAAPLLDRLTRDPEARVAELAAASLGARPTPAGRARLVELCRGADDGVRLAALEALAPELGPADLDLLRTTYSAASGELARDVRIAVLDAAAKLPGEDTLAFLRAAAGDPDPLVSRTADRLRRERGDEVALFAPRATRKVEAVPVPPPGTRNPFVEVETTRGTLAFELFPSEAPTHVRNFLELARRDFYDGLTFHRVVADFVIQGGCPRGDGNGGGTWRGPDDILRAEFGPRPYVRGSLGMPRSADPDSGGCQLFVTHRPTPHLDAAYTIFGELREGFDVLDAIAVGDRILDVRER